MLDNLEKYQIYLASKSPRRYELLKGLDLNFELKDIDVSEDYPLNMEVFEVAKFLAKKKSDAFKDEIKSGELIITADTIVVLGSEILEKPKSKDHAAEMLTKLSGKEHIVVTGVSILTAKKQVIFSDKTKVVFDEILDGEIAYYLKKYQPFDKAGSYGVQEWIGYIGIKSIDGSYYNVMGLPVHKLYKELKKI